MSKNIDQVFIANPITSNTSTDLMYFGQSPYGAGNDAAMTYANFSAQFGAPYTPAALTEVNDTNVTLTLGGTPATALLHAVSITAGWSGQLSLARGGTNANLTASNGGIVWSNATQFQILAGTATANQVLLSGSSATPAWSTATYPATTTINQLLYSSAANTIGGLATTNSAALSTNATGVPTWLALTDGQLVIGSSVGAPLAANITSSDSSITITNGHNSISLTASSGSGSPLTTKGDLYTFSTVNTRLAVGGTNGQILQVSSGAGTGLAWSTAAYPSTTTANQLLYSSATNTVGGLTSANGGVLVTNNTGVPSILAGSGTTGTVLQATASGTPAWSTATYPLTTTINNILYSTSTNVVGELGATNNAALASTSAGVPQWLALTDGQIVIGSSAGAPTAATLTAGTGISITNGHNSITIANTTNALTYNDVSGTSQAAAVNNGYIISNASQTTVTLPATAAEGSRVAVQGKGAAGWILAANTGQVIHLGSSASSSAGSLTSTNQWDTVTVVCVTANTTWAASSVIGNLTVA